MMGNRKKNDNLGGEVVMRQLCISIVVVVCYMNLYVLFFDLELFGNSILLCSPWLACKSLCKPVRLLVFVFVGCRVGNVRQGFSVPDLP